MILAVHGASNMIKTKVITEGWGSAANTKLLITGILSHKSCSKHAQWANVMLSANIKLG